MTGTVGVPNAHGKKKRKGNMYYAVVTFGLPSPSCRKVHQSLKVAGDVAREVKGTGTCTAAHVLECPTRQSARDADISVVARGQKTVLAA